MECVVFKILGKCNWNCEYCDNTNDLVASLYKVKHYVEKVQRYNPDILISFTGGEPGLLGESYLEEIFSILLKPCEIATNGTFIRNGLYYRFSDKINYISYHVTSDINKLEKISKLDIDAEVSYIIVIHKQNLDSLIPFLELNSDINFKIKPYIGIDKKLLLDQKDIQFLYKNIIIGNINNLVQEHKNNIMKFHNNKFENIKIARDQCSKRIFVPRIDLVDDIIYRCCAGNNNSVDFSPLNDITLNIILKRNVFPSKKGNCCINCTHSFVAELLKDK